MATIRFGRSRIVEAPPRPGRCEPKDPKASLHGLWPDLQPRELRLPRRDDPRAQYRPPPRHRLGGACGGEAAVLEDPQPEACLSRAQHSTIQGGRQSIAVRNGIALTCIAIPEIIQIVVGTIYFTASEIMPYHKEYLGVPWSDLEPTVRAMRVGFLHIIGANQLCFLSRCGRLASRSRGACSPPRWP